MEDRRVWFKRYYEEKIKPFRKIKGVFGQMKMRCFMCGHFIDYKKYMEKQPSVIIDVRLWEFGGRANIKVTNFADIKPEFREFVKNVLISKLKTMLRDLKQAPDTVQGFIEMPIGSQTYETKLNNLVEVKYGN